MKNIGMRRPPIIDRGKRLPCKSSFGYEIDTFEFLMGEVYLFHRSNVRCPRKSSLWGMFDKRVGTDVYLESSSEGALCDFVLWHKLPDDYRFCRLATREELR